MPGWTADARRQGSSGVRFDWATRSATAVAVGADFAVVVDVLPFTTTLTVAFDDGTVVLPYRFDGETAVS